MGIRKSDSKVMVSPRKAEAMKGVKGGPAKIQGYANGGCVTRVSGSSKVVSGK